MIKCKEDLLNTYIENDQGELRELYIKAGQRLNVNVWSNDTLKREFISCSYPEVETHSSTIFLLGGHRPYHSNSKQLTLSDFKPKLKTKVEYVKCEESLNDIAKAMIDGELFYSEDGDVTYNWHDGSFDDQYGDTFIVVGEFHRKVETEVTWQDEISDDRTHVYIYDLDKQVAIDRMPNDMFIAMCHLVASMTDKPEV